jgi:hypothetical protein
VRDVGWSVSMTRREALVMGGVALAGSASAAALPMLKVGAALPDPPFELMEGKRHGRPTSQVFL